MIVCALALFLAQPFDLEPRSRETRRWVDFLLVTRANQTQGALKNAQRYVPRFRKIFREEGVPEDLLWLAMIESSFRTDPTSKSKAQGMYQFKKDTARAFGLRVNRVLDERNVPDLAARAAARYLLYLHAKFKDWDLVLAAYNLGEGDLRRTMKRRRAKTWRQVKPYVRKETQNYVGKVKAAAVVGNKFMQTGVIQKPPPGMKRHTVRKGDTLYNISKRYKVTVNALKRRNGIRGTDIKIGQVLVIPTTKNSSRAGAPTNR